MALCLVVRGTYAQEQKRAADSRRGHEIANWAVPTSWSPASAPSQSRSNLVSGVAAEDAVTSPLPFIGVSPCRLADTRDSTKPPGYGPPNLTAGVPRNFVVAGQCGVDPSAQAVSLNLTVVNPEGVGYILVFPQGGPFAPVSTLNYVAGETIANAAIVPVGASGGITVDAGVSGADLIIDVNGYFGAGSGAANTFVGLSGGNFTTTGEFNSGFGYQALNVNSGGGANSAFGAFALFQNTTGNYNTAFGASSLLANSGGSANTAIGTNALASNGTGDGNTAIGDATLPHSTGSTNVAIGAGTGSNLVTGDYNIYIENLGVDGDQGTMRLGDPAFLTRAFIAGIRGVTTGNADAIPVVIDSAGQLGTVSSSARFKEDIRDLADESSGLLKLRPVSFRYKGHADGPRQFGLIAEEVEDVLPDLVVHDASGQAETVLYHEMPAMLLNELQKQQRELDRLRQLVEGILARDADGK